MTRRTEGVRLSITFCRHRRDLRIRCQPGVATNSIIIGFNVRPDVAAKRAADASGIDIRFYNIIYNLLDEVKAAMTGLLAPDLPGCDRRVRGSSRNLQVARWRCGRRHVCAGRQDRPQQQGACASQRSCACSRAASNPSSASRTMSVKWRAGYECGLGLDGFNDLQVEGSDRVLPPRRGRPYLKRCSA